MTARHNFLCLATAVTAAVASCVTVALNAQADNGTTVMVPAKAPAEAPKKASPPLVPAAN